MKAPLTDLIVVTERIKHALIHVYNKMNAVRRSASNLPKLLSVLDILTPNERRVLQFVLANLSTKTMKDLGCYFYIIESIGRTHSSRDLSFETNPTRNILDHWHILEASASLSIYNKVYMPRYEDDQTFMSNISYYLFGMDAPSMVCIAYQLKEKNIELLARHVKWFLEFNGYPPPLKYVIGNKFILDPLCPQLWDLVASITSSSYGACFHRYETSMGSYTILFDPASSMFQSGTLVAPFMISRVKPVEYFPKKLRATGWLTIPSLRPLSWGIPGFDTWASTVAARCADPRAPYWRKIPSLRRSYWNFNASCCKDFHVTPGLGDVQSTYSTFNTIIKSRLAKLEFELELELKELEGEDRRCQCELCMPL